MKTNILKVFGFAALAAFCANVWADVAGLPVAVVTEITDSTELAKFKANIVNVESVDEVDDIHLNSTTVFELTPKRAFKFECDPNEADGNAYLGWYADYTVSFNKAVAKNSMGLFGNYGSYSIGFFAPLEVPANYKVPLLNYMTKNVNWTYQMIRKDVTTFVCGAFNLSSDNADTTMTVELRLFDPSVFMSSADVRDSSKWVENVNTYVVRSITYKLSDVTNVPAKADSWPELEYVDVATDAKPFPAGYYALEGSEFVKLSEAKDVTQGQTTAYFKPVEKKEEVKVEVAEDVQAKTTATDKEGRTVEIPTEKQEVVVGKVETAIEEIVNNKPAQEKTDTGVTAKEILTETKNETVVVKDAIKDGIKASEEYTAAPDEVKTAVDTALNSKDVSSKINIILEATGVTVDTTEQVEVTVTKAVFDVKPLATVTVVTGTETNEFTTVIPNDELAGKALTVRLPLPKSFIHNVRVIHESTGYPTEEYIVASQLGADGERFCEVQVTHFSTMTTVDTTEAIPVKYESVDVLGIIRKSAGSNKEGYENAIAVPWASRAASGDIVPGMTVADLITANGLGAGDELHVWIPASGTTHTGATGVTRKGTYAIFQWDAAQQKWIGARDMDSGTCPVGTDYLIPRGAAVWYKRASGTTGDYTIVGLVSNVCETAVTAGTADEPVMTLLVNPFPEAVDAAQIAGADGDELIINRTNSEGTNVSYTRRGTVWGRLVDGSIKIGTKTIKTQEFQTATTILVANGQSFWYVSRGGSPTINWKQIKTVGNE